MKRFLLIMMAYMFIAPIFNGIWQFYNLELIVESQSFPNLRFILSLLNFVLLYTLFGVYLRRKEIEPSSSEHEKRQKKGLFMLANVFVLIITFNFLM